MAEFLAGVGCKTLFATHYHNLNDLEKQQDGVRNYRIAVREDGHRILWLRKTVRGGTDKSYGVQVARLAGLPPEVIARAREVLTQLEENEGHGEGREGGPPAAHPPQPVEARPEGLSRGRHHEGRGGDLQKVSFRKDFILKGKGHFLSRWCYKRWERRDSAPDFAGGHNHGGEHGQDRRGRGSAGRPG